MNSVNIKDVTRDYTSDYAKYVAINRAIPSLMDGLKPVHRRCLLSAYDLKLFHDKKFLKLAKLEGDVMGSYHPHGGADAVGLTQPFTTRYPLFIGQGNYGSPDLPGSYAASRYLEIKLSEFAEKFYLSSIDYADKEDNYDGRLKETTLFYPALPGCLFTGAQGIAIGLSTYIPSHNIKDVAESFLKYLDNPDKEDYLDNLMPDTCESSVILSSKEDIRKMYEKGEGSITYKASTHYETFEGKSALVVDAFPPGYSKKRLETSFILDAVSNGTLELINESKETVRYVFTSPDMEVLSQVEERLTNSVGYRFYIEHRGIIKKYPLKEVYDTFLQEKVSYIGRKYKDLLNKVSYELSYLDILIAFKQDREYIKHMFDKTSAEVVLDIVKKYDTTEDIAKRIISTSLRSLLADNVSSLENNRKSLQSSIDEYSLYLENPLVKVKKDIEDLLLYMKDDKRRAVHVDQITSTYEHTYEGKTVEIQADKIYFLGNPDNTYEIVYGEDLRNTSLPKNLVVPATYPYYLLYDEKGVCGVSKETMLKGWSKLKSDRLVGIIGTEDFKDIDVVQGNGKKTTLYDWVVRQRTSYIELSKEGQPDIVVYAPSPFKG